MTEAQVEPEDASNARPGLLPASSISRPEAVVNQIGRGIVLGGRDPDRIEAALQAHPMATAAELIALRHPSDHPQDQPGERAVS